MTKTAVIIDGHNLMYRALFPAHKQEPLDFSFRMWKEITLMSVVEYISKFNPTEVVLALDNRHNWRSDVYSSYKCNRKAKRGKTTVDFEKFFPVSEKFWEDLKETFSTMKVLKVDRCEGDDIIAVLTKVLYKDFDSVINISTDKDFYQLFLEDNYKQYNPTKKEFVQVVNPKRLLEYKIIDGDDGDDIPPAYMTGNKRKRSKAIVEKILDTDMETFLQDSSNKEKYLRNKSLIDFKMIPKEIQNSIIESYNDTKIEEMKRNSLGDFFERHNLKLYEELQRINYCFKGLYGKLDSGKIYSN